MDERWEYNERKKIADDLKRVGAVPVLEAETLRRLLLVDASPTAAPETFDRAVEADNYWSRADTHWNWRLRRAYANLFRGYSSVVHPTMMGIDTFIQRDELRTRECGSRLINIAPCAA